MKVSKKLYNKGMEFENQGKYSEAVKCFCAAVTLDQNYQIAWLWKGWCEEKLNQYVKAVQSCDQAIQLDPNDSSAWNNKGYALDNLGKYEEAVNCYDQAIQLDPNDRQAWNNEMVLELAWIQKKPIAQVVRGLYEVDLTWREGLRQICSSDKTKRRRVMRVDRNNRDLMKFRMARLHPAYMSTCKLFEEQICVVAQFDKDDKKDKDKKGGKKVEDKNQQLSEDQQQKLQQDAQQVFSPCQRNQNLVQLNPAVLQLLFGEYQLKETQLQFLDVFLDTTRQILVPVVFPKDAISEQAMEQFKEELLKKIKTEENQWKERIKKERKETRQRERAEEMAKKQAQQ